MGFVNLLVKISKWCITNYMWVKYKTITNNTLLVILYPQMFKWSKEDGIFSNEGIGRNEHSIIPIGDACIFTSLYILQKNSHLPFTKINKIWYQSTLLEWLWNKRVGVAVWNSAWTNLVLLSDQNLWSNVRYINVIFPQVTVCLLKLFYAHCGVCQIFRLSWHEFWYVSESLLLWTHATTGPT